MMMKHLVSLAVALGLMVAAAAPARAAEPPLATGLVETPSAVFFQPAAFPNVVWYFPKSELKLAVVEPVLPGPYAFWRASVVLKKIGDADLAALPAEWTGKSIVPYILRPTTECALTRLPEMRTIVQEVKALGRDITAGNPLTPVCRFSLRLPQPIPAALQASLNALLASDSLVARELRLQVRSEAKVAWSDVHAAVESVLSAPPEDQDGGVATSANAPMTRAAATAAIEEALFLPELAAVDAVMTPAERTAFVTAALARLFTADPVSPATMVRLVLTAPTGSVVYHAELFDRVM
jgi:hypothetical protein